MAVVIRGEHYTTEVCDFGRLPVHIVRTRVEDGLSAPITFDSIPEDQREGVVCENGVEISAIETTLETAVSFLMDLEQREIAAFGLQPDPVESTRNLENGFLNSPVELLGLAERLG